LILYEAVHHWKLDGFVSQLTHSLLTILGVTTSTISEQRGFFFFSWSNGNKAKEPNTKQRNKKGKEVKLFEGGNVGYEEMEMLPPMSMEATHLVRLCAVQFALQ